jgi:hypothetical protein
VREGERSSPQPGRSDGGIDGLGGGQDIASTPSSGSYAELMAVCERSRIDTIVPAA